MLNKSEHLLNMRLSGPLRPAPFPRRLVRLPMLETMICGGFPSPADDHRERTVDLNEELIRNEPATFLFRVVGHSGRDEYVRDGDIAVCDRSIKPRHGHIVAATIDDESCVKMFCQRGGRTWLASANPLYPDIELSDESEVVIEGVVTWTLHRHGGARA